MHIEQAEIEQADIFQEKVHLVLIEIDDARRIVPATGLIIERPLTSPTPTDPTHDTSDTHTTEATHPMPIKHTPPSADVHVTKVMLPKLTLKKFNEDLTNWATFWYAFESAIHENPNLSDIDKFNYLSSLLEHPASDAIADLKLTAANYAEAIVILKKWFGNKQHNITKHMDALLSIDAVTLQYNLKGLRHLYDSVETQVRGLRSLGIPPESYGSFYCPS